MMEQITQNNVHTSVLVVLVYRVMEQITQNNVYTSVLVVSQYTQARIKITAHESQYNIFFILFFRKGEFYY